MSVAMIERSPKKSGGFNKGYVQVYTGNGKGKTTAAIGLAIRAAGAGLKVFIGQFMKSGDYSEIRSLKKYSELITIDQFGTGKFLNDKPTAADLHGLKDGLEKIKAVFSSGDYQLVIMEEVNVAVICGLLSVKELLNIVHLKPKAVELVITGRYAFPQIIEVADLVTEMKEIKHYYQKGVQARTGIEK